MIDDRQQDEKHRWWMLPEEEWQVVKSVAQALGETGEQPRRQLTNMARICGIEFIQRLLEKTLETEASGGMLTRRGDRRRTPGGVFFYLARGAMDGEQRRQVFPNPYHQKAQQDRLSCLEWSDRFRVIQRIQNKGEVEEMQVKLMGRPGEVRRQGSTVVLQMEHQGGGASLPVGVPPMPETPTIFTVYIAQKQWAKVERSVKEADRWLVVEGLCSLDTDTQTVAVFATSVQTKRPKTSKDEPGESEAGNDDEPVDDGRPTPEAPPADAIPLPPPLEEIIPEGAPSETRTKLADLYTAAKRYRTMLADIEAKPENQRFGQQMTRKLLTNVEAQIKTLIKQHSPE